MDHMTATFNTWYEGSWPMCFLAKSELPPLSQSTGTTFTTIGYANCTPILFYYWSWSSHIGHWLHQSHKQEFTFWSQLHGLHCPSHSFLNPKVQLSSSMQENVRPSSEFNMQMGTVLNPWEERRFNEALSAYSIHYFSTIDLSMKSRLNHQETLFPWK